MAEARLGLRKKGDIARAVEREGLLFWLRCDAFEGNFSSCILRCHGEKHPARVPDRCDQILGARANSLQPGTGRHRNRLLCPGLPCIEIQLDGRFLSRVVSARRNRRHWILRSIFVDIFAQASGFRDVWRRSRKILLGIGTLFAAIIT